MSSCTSWSAVFVALWAALAAAEERDVGPGDSPGAAGVAAGPTKVQGVRGGSFEVGGTGGLAVFDPDLAVEPCPWFGGFAGHRFEPLAERVYLGFRAGWEGCVASRRGTGDRVDFIYVDVAFTTAVAARPWLLVYGMTGGGFLIADTTPSGGEPFPRTAFQGGGGVAFVLARYLLIDVGARVLAFENIQFGGVGGLTGTTANPLITLSLGGHI